MKFSPYSYSRIAVYQTCPRKFKYSYIDKLPKKPQDMTALLKGGALHHILEHYPESSTHKLAPKYQHIADSFIATRSGQEILCNESHREMNIGLDKNLKECKYGSKEAMFRGSIDFFTFKAGFLWIVDYKSGKRKEQKWQSYDQNMFYAIWFFQKYSKIDKIKITYQYIEHENYDNSLMLERRYLDNYKNTLLTNINNIETDEVFDITVGPLCNWCDFQEHCDKETPKDITE